MDGVEMDRANVGEPFIKYCGPFEKFVSCAKAIPIDITTVATDK
jgi:hypothetical protein